MALPLRKPLLSDVAGDARSFLDDFSIEVTRPNAADLEAVRAVANRPANRPMRIYVSAVPARPSADLIAQAAMVRRAGFEPVPHIAVRNYAGREELSSILSRLASEAAVRHVLVIAGDRADPAGPFTSSIEIIESGMLQRHGVTRVSIGGHPEGHPVVADDVMTRALLAKVEAAGQSGLTADIVTQFGFDAHAISRFIVKLRDLGVECPVRVGMAGPTNLATLLKFAQRCGVKASVGGVARNIGLVKHLFGVSAPDHIVRALAGEKAAGSLGPVSAHFFSFGGIAATAKWAAHAAQGRIALTAEGFSVEP